jgi:PAS domain S-box-containing protein
LSRANAALQQEIANRIQAEQALQHERNILEVTLASIGDAVIATDTTAALTFINPVAETLTGWTAREAIGRNLAEVFHIINEQTRQAVDNPVQKVLREGRVVGLANHTVLIARDGRETPIADSGAPIQGANGQVYGTVMVFRDISESKQAETALVRAKEAAEAADRIKDEFLATMSHELRTPLNVILGYTDMLMEEAVGTLSPQQIAILRRIDHNSRVLFELISMVLDLNRLEAGRLPVDVREIQVEQFLTEIKAEMQGLCDQSGLAYKWQVAVGLPPLRTDPGKLKVVIKNLLSNAVKFTKEGGVTVTACQRGEGIEISVTDTGIGIAPDAQAFIFEPFRQVDSSDTRSYSGSGLGLHIVKRLLEVLGGNITVTSAVGRGSTFQVWVPTLRTSDPSSDGSPASAIGKE